MNEAFQMERHNDLYFTRWYGVYAITRPDDTMMEFDELVSMVALQF